MSAHLPIVDSDSRVFWEALGDGALMLPRCDECEAVHYYPRALCPRCWGTVTWVELTGRGTVFATSTVRRIGFEPFRGRLPYDVSIVELDEGPRLLTNIIDCDPDVVSIGAQVVLSPTLDGEQWLPTFRLQED